jgi:hypothetical protein
LAGLLAQSQEFLSTNLGSSFKVVDTYGELFRSNPLLLQSVTDESVITIVRCMLAAQNENMAGSRFIELLAMMCGSTNENNDEVPMASNQVRILEHFIKARPEMLCELRVNDTVPEYRYVKAIETASTSAPGKMKKSYQNESVWIPLRDIREVDA